ncbi:MAG: hypothetical protein GC159_18395 [Phycisphaera sp.]|nr:hypothetical protein [Phycisphaera sp.]
MSSQINAYVKKILISVAAIGGVIGVLYAVISSVWFARFVGRMLGLEDIETIHSIQVKFASPWAQERTALVLFFCVAVAIVAFTFYRSYQPSARRGRTAIGILRAALLALLVTILAEPVIAMAFTERPRPLLLLLFDGTDSMNINDRLADDAVTAIAKTSEDNAGKADPDAIAEASRLQLVQQVIKGKVGEETFNKLAEKFRLRAYVMDRIDQTRELELTTDTSKPDSVQGPHLAEQIDAEGQVTALGEAFNDLRRRHRARPAGVIVFSDFDQNTGTPPVPAAKQLEAPIFTVGVGPREVVDLSVDLRTPLVLKKDEKASVNVFIRQSGLDGRAARVQLLARRLGTAGGVEEAEPTPVAPPKTVELNGSRVSFDLPFLPSMTGRFLLQVKVDPFDGEVLEDNNVAEREVTIRDDSLKLLFVEYEPTWEWRFVKEVFHRDPLIGHEGFRTFLRSADFKVRRTNDMFIDTLVRPRSEFFGYDVIFLSDIPNEMLSEHFQSMLKEYVEKFGGGLVVLTGPRNGLQALYGTEIADMLPVVIDPSLRVRDSDFKLNLTAEAADTDFMKLGSSEAENRRAWDNLGRLPWYYPVARPHPLATVLAQHPTDKCVDNKTPQPIIATRRYGKGEVIYMGFNEMWRLRRKYGEEYYRQFWGQMIYRLGLGRALGAQKRFQVYTDRPTYRAGDKVRITVEAYDMNYEPLDVQKLESRLMAEGHADQQGTTTDLTIPVARDNVVFETTVPVYSAGAHRVLVKDPVTNEEVEAHFKVAPVTAERRNAVRDFALQQTLAAQTGGKTYELSEIAALADDVKAPVVEDYTEKRVPLWNTWLVLTMVLTLMLGEWLIRKLVNLR